jgi:rubrerythrin
MSLDILRNTGTPIERQTFTWAEMAGLPTSKLDSDAFTRVRIILMNGIESESVRFQHACARMQSDLHLELAQVRRVEQHQQTMVNWLLPPDLSPLETTISFEQVAVEITAAVAMREPDAYLSQVYRFGLLEDFDHLYRFSALLDRMCGKDANGILQSYSDILPGRPTSVEHRVPEDDLRLSYDRRQAAPLSKLHAYTIMAAENQTHDYYMTIGPMFADPLARQLYAEIASIEEQHTTQYESIIDPEETWLEKWLLHEATEVYNYHSCALQETDSRVRAIWERCLDYELGHLHLVRRLFEHRTRRDSSELLPETLPDPLPHRSQRRFVRDVLAKEATLRAVGTEIVPLADEKPNSPSVAYRQQLNSAGSPSQIVAANYQWRPGGELMEQATLQATVH